MDKGMYAGLSVSRNPPPPCIENSFILEVNYIPLKKRPAKLIMILHFIRVHMLLCIQIILFVVDNLIYSHKDLFVGAILLLLIGVYIFGKYR